MSCFQKYKRVISYTLSATSLSGIILGTILGTIAAILENVNNHEELRWTILVLSWGGLVLWIFSLLLFFVLTILNLWCRDFGLERDLTILSNRIGPNLRTRIEDLQASETLLTIN